MLLNPWSANFDKTSRTTSLTQIYVKAQVQNQQTKPHFYGLKKKRNQNEIKKRRKKSRSLTTFIDGSSNWPQRNK